MTSDGSNILNSEEELKKSYPGLTFAKGLLMNDVSDDEIKEWVNNFDIRPHLTSFIAR